MTLHNMLYRFMQHNRQCIDHINKSPRWLFFNQNIQKKRRKFNRY